MGGAKGSGKVPDFLPGIFQRVLHIPNHFGRESFHL